jgi:hypothetical protein
VGITSGNGGEDPHENSQHEQIIDNFHEEEK